ncbi:ANTAR domain-containing protein [Kineococcus gynurae]|uniref:ANTAR domain-containing protein n=1 Tax=Kineococcus gynurae TaxID=452979 RepID=A0ABV5LNZ5_9ACTN
MQDAAHDHGPDHPAPDSSAAEVDALRAELDQIKRALQRRPVIDLAKGAIMALTACTEDAAFKRLSTASQTHNVKLFDVSSALVADLTRIAEGQSPSGHPAVAAALAPAAGAGRSVREQDARPAPHQAQPGITTL